MICVPAASATKAQDANAQGGIPGWKRLWTSSQFTIIEATWKPFTIVF